MPISRSTCRKRSRVDTNDRFWRKADLFNVLQAQQTLFSAEDQLAQTILANRQAAVHLFEALGGGWQENPNDRTQFAKNTGG